MFLELENELTPFSCLGGDEWLIDKLSHQLNQILYVKDSGSLTEETTDPDTDIIPESPQPKRANCSRQVF